MEVFIKDVVIKRPPPPHTHSLSIVVYAQGHLANDIFYELFLLAEMNKKLKQICLVRWHSAPGIEIMCTKSMKNKLECVLNYYKLKQKRFARIYWRSEIDKIGKSSECLSPKIAKELQRKKVFFSAAG